MRVTQKLVNWSQSIYLRMGDVYLQERQDTVIDSDTIVLILVSVAAFIGQLLAVFIGM